MGLLDGDLSQSLYQGFKGRLLKGELRRYGGSDTLDSHGDPEPAPYQSWQIEGYEDDYSAFTRASAGIPDTDFKLCFFAASANPSGLVPQEGDVANLGRGWASIRKAATDPAQALWTCQSFRTELPE
jgi:hypothetical protein